MIVTGSRIERSGFEAPSPLTVIGVEELQSSSVTNVGDQLNKIPAFQGSQASQTIGSTGQRDPAASYLNLRNLGTNRTLVLLDGKRHVASSASGAVDSNLIPFALIERAEVVTGGASAAYGSDAVAGVVNFIINRKFEGVKATVQAGVTEAGDAPTQSVSLAMGSNFLDNRLNVAFAGQYFHSGEFEQTGDLYDWNDANWGLVQNPAYTPTNGQYRLIASPNVGFSTATNGGVIIANSGPLRGIQFGANGAVEPFIYGDAAGNTFMIGGSGQTLNPTTRIGPIDIKRLNGYGRIGYEFSDNLSATFEVTLADSSGHSQITRNTDVGAGGSITIRQDNAYLPETIRQTMVANNIQSFRMGRLNPEFGFIEPHTDASLQRYVLSFDGGFGDGWSWNVYGQFGKTRYDQVYVGNRNQNRWALATDAVRAPNGEIVCRSTLTNPGNGCIPANVFGEGALYTTDVASYVLQNPSSTTRSEQRAAGVSLTGTPFDLWAGPVSFAMGAEWRKDELVTDADFISNTESFRVGSVTSMGGGYSVKEAFVETVVPLLTDMTFARSLELNAAARATDYSISGSVETWKVGLTYQPIDALRFRGAISRDIRAASINELFASGRQNSGGTVFDPFTNMQYAPRSIPGGSTALTPEEADSVTYGIVWSPAGALSGLRASVDRYEIELNNAIGTLGTQNIVDFCFQGNTALCGLIDRDANNAITAIHTNFVNYGWLETSGVDTEVAYNLPLESVSDRLSGNLGFRLLATWVEKYRQSDGASVVELSGDASSPDWKFSSRLTYANGPLRLYLEDQYIPSQKIDASYGPQDLQFNHVSSMNVVNFTANYALLRGEGANMEVFLTVNNLLDEDPPIVPSSSVQSNQTVPATYDANRTSLHGWREDRVLRKADRGHTVARCGRDPKHSTAYLSLQAS